MDISIRTVCHSIDILESYLIMFFYMWNTVIYIIANVHVEIKFKYSVHFHKLQENVMTCSVDLILSYLLQYTYTIFLHGHHRLQIN